METNSRKIARRLLKDGFELISVRGSHHTDRKGARMVILLPPKKELPLGTVRAIYQQAGWSTDQ